MSSKTAALAALVIALLCSNAAAWAAPRAFKIDDSKKRDSVSFTSDAPLELIGGKTSDIKGNITIDDSLDLSKPVDCSFQVDLSTIDTGIPLRNEHMRDNFLHTKDFPNGKFAVKKLINPPHKLEPGTKAKVQAIGELSLNGKTVSKTIPVEITYFSKCKATETKVADCDLIQIKATFPVAFKEFNIPRPEVVFQKLADTVIVTVSATAYNQVGPSGKEKNSAAENKAK